MRAERLFGVLVAQGALIAGCSAPSVSPQDAGQDRGAQDTGVQDTAEQGDTAIDTGVCEESLCSDTESWVDCTADGVRCCWAAAACCDACCGHLDP